MIEHVNELIQNIMLMIPILFWILEVWSTVVQSPNIVPWNIKDNNYT